MLTRRSSSLVERLQSLSAEHRAGVTFIRAANEEHEVPYAELYARAARTLGGLAKCGVAAGDALILHIGDPEPFVVVFWACLLGGVTAVPISATNTAEAAERLERCWQQLGRPRVVSDSARRARGRPGAANVDVSGFLGGRRIDAAELVTSAAKALPVHVDDATTALIQFSSGSTGAPKGVVLTHANLNANIADIVERARIAPDDVCLSWMPLVHDMALIGSHLTACAQRVQQYIMPTSLFVGNPLLWLTKAAEHRATVLSSPTFGYQHVLARLSSERVGRLDLSAVRLIFNGAEPVDAAVCRSFLEQLSEAGLRATAMYPVYGLAEASVAVSMPEPGLGVRPLRVARESLVCGSRVVTSEAERGATELVALGRPLASCELRVTDALGVELPEGVVGQLAVRGPNVSAGYYGEEPARGGWRDTRDLGFLRDGVLYVVGRSDDALVIAGRNLFPDDVERAVLARTTLSAGSLAACALPGASGSAARLAVFVRFRKPAGQFAELAAQIREAALEGVGVLPAVVLPVREIPRTTSGKARRFLLVERYQSGQFTDAEAELARAERELAQARRGGMLERASRISSADRAQFYRAELRAVARACSPDGELDDTISLSDQGLDSLSLTRLSLRVSSHFGLEIEAATLFSHPSLSRLASYVAEQLHSEPAPKRSEARASAVATAPRDDRVAVIGLGCRFPGAADSPESFWRCLVEGAVAAREVPASRFPIDHYFDPRRDAPGKTYTRFGSFVQQELRSFDAAFFGMTPLEAESLDPCQRLLLEVSWEAFEHACIAPSTLRGSSSAVFVGLSPDASGGLSGRDLAGLGPHHLTGSLASTAAGRLSYFYDLRGPCLTVDTACSSSLAAVHLACQSLSSGEAELAIAAGVNLLTSPGAFVALSRLNALSADGRCKAFDAGADGYGRGEGCGVVILRRLSDALARNDRILGVIAGSAMNHDGRSNGLTAPNPRAQSEVVRRALERAGVDPHAVGYVEAHGTGTELGDPIELHALTEALARRSADAPTLRVGSVKANVGHLEAAAGVAGLIKVLLMLQARGIPPQVGLSEPNPRIDWHGSAVSVPRQYESMHGPLIAGVSSFGLSGTNVHVLVSSGPESPSEDSARESDGRQLLYLSAETPAALHELVEGYVALLSASSPPSLRDVCLSAALGREHFRERLAVSVASTSDAVAALQAFGAGGSSPCRRGTLRAASGPRVALLFSGQGSQYPGMGRRLYEREPVFRASIDASAALLSDLCPVSLQAFMFEPEACGVSLSRTRFAQPAIVALQMALFELWREAGVEPSAVLGHSVGELTAAWVNGALDARDALRIAAVRGQLMDSLPEGGAMLAILAPEARVQSILAEVSSASVAAQNGRQNLVISGDVVGIQRVAERAQREGWFARRLDVSHAFHSAQMDPILADLGACLGGIEFRRPSAGFYSSVHGRALGDDERLDASYWVANCRQPVRFGAALEALVKESFDVFIEVGATPVLSAIGRHDYPEREFLASLVKGGDDVESFQNQLAAWYTLGGRPDRRERTVSRFRKLSLPRTPLTRVADGAATPPPPLTVRRTGGEDVLGALRGMLARSARLEHVDVDRDLFGLGLDSMLLIAIRAQIAGEWGVEIELSEFHGRAGTLRGLAALIDERRTSTPIRVEARAASSQAVTGAAPPVSAPARSAVGQRESAPYDERQRRGLSALIERYTQRTAPSKDVARRFRDVLASSRRVAGFRATFKEMIYPLTAERAAGARFWDAAGNEFLDLTMGFGVHLLGHQPECVVTALQERIARSASLGPMSELAGDVAALIRKLTGVERVAFATTGTEAVMLALRLARAGSERRKIVLFAGSYHGSFDGVLALDGGDPARLAIPAAPGIPPGMVEDVVVLPYGRPESLAAIEKLGHELAAVLVEPVQSRRPDLQPRDFLRDVRAATERSGCALIFDEIVTGFRVHPGGAQAHFGVQADIVTYGKIVGGGLPIGVVAGKARWLDAVDGGTWQFGDESRPHARQTFHAGTYNHHPLSLVAARAVLAELDRLGAGFQLGLNQLTGQLATRLNGLFEARRAPVSLVSFGSLFRFAPRGDGELLYYELISRGVYVWEGRNCFLSGAHGSAEVDAIVRVVDESLQSLEEAGLLDAADRRHTPAGSARLPDESPARFPLAATQRDLFQLCQAGASAAFNHALVLRFEGALDLAMLRRALELTAARHEALRTIQVRDTGRTIAPRLSLEIELVEATADEARFVRRFASDEFDCEHGPLFRVGASARSARAHAVVFVFHHLVADGWSIGLALSDLADAYSGLRAGVTSALAPAPGFCDFVERLESRRAAAERTRHYWLEHAASCTLALAGIGRRASRPVSPAGRVTLRLPVALRSALGDFNRRQGVTLAMTLLAAWRALLFRIGGVARTAVWVPISGQHALGMPGVVGPCSAVLPICVPIEDETRFVDLLGAVKSALLRASDHYLPVLPAEAGALPMDALFNLDSVPNLPSFAELDVTLVSVPPAYARVDVSLNVLDTGDGCELAFDHRLDRFDADRVAEWSRHYLALLEAVMVEPEQAVTRVRMSRGERQARLERASHQDLRALLRAQAPSRVALVSGERSWTLGELHSVARDIGAILRCHAERGEVVLFASADIAWSAAIGLALLESPVAALCPRARAVPQVWSLCEPEPTVIYADAAARAVLSGSPVLASARLFDLEQGAPASAGASSRWLTDRGAVRLPSQLLAVDAAGLSAAVAGLRERLGATPEWVAAPEECGAPSLELTLYALVAGAPLLTVAPDRPAARGAVLVLSQAEHATHASERCWQITHTPALEVVLLGGERPFAGDVELTRRRFPHLRRSHHLFWPEVASRCVSALSLARDTNVQVLGPALPLGEALGDLELEVLDPEGVPLGCDLLGELAVIPPGRSTLGLGVGARRGPDSGVRIERKLAGRAGCAYAAREIDVFLRSTGFVSAVRVREAGPRMTARVVGKGSAPGLIGLLRERARIALGEVRWLDLQRAGAPLGEDSSAVWSENASASEGERPVGELEQRIAAAFSDVLGVTGITRHDDFFSLGGHSLGAVQVAAKLAATRGGSSVTLRDVFEAPVVSALARRIAEQRAPALPRIERAPAAEDYALSPSQRGVWLHEQLQPGSADYNVSALLVVRGKFEHEALRQAFEDVVARHEAFRTVFVLRAGEPRQKIAPRPPERSAWLLDDAAALEPGDAGLSVARLAMADAIRPFDLARGPLFRARFVRLGEEQQALLFTIHHIVSDGWSLDRFVKEVLRAYACRRAGYAARFAPLALEYRDYAEWLVALQSSSSMEAQRQRWHARLARLPPALGLPTDFSPRTVPCFAGAVRSLEIDETRAEALRSLASLHGVTLYILLVALVRCLLYRVTGQQEFTLGGSFAERVDERILDTHGFFVNAVTFVGRVGGDETFASALARERRTVVDALEDGLYPFDLLLEELGCNAASGRSTLFEAQVVLQGDSQRELAFEGISDVELRLITTSSRFDLVFNFREIGSRLVLELEYRTALFSAARVELLCRRFARLAAQVARDPEQTLDSFEIDEGSVEPSADERFFTVDLQR